MASHTGPNQEMHFSHKPNQKNTSFSNKSDLKQTHDQLNHQTHNQNWGGYYTAVSLFVATPCFPALALVFEHLKYLTQSESKT